MQIVAIVLWGIAILILIVVIDGVVLLYRLVSGGACGLKKALFFPDTCGGTCPPGSTCRAIATRPYMFGLGTQSAGCGCIAPAGGTGPGGTGTGGTGTGTGTGGGGTTGSGGTGGSNTGDGADGEEH